MSDNVKCTNCNFEGLVPVASESCPLCNMEGSLAWAAEEKQEIEHPMDNSSVLCPVCSCQLNHMDKVYQDQHIEICRKETQEDEWIDSHSVNCLTCNNLVDERDCINGPGGVGNICPSCQKDYTASEND